MKTKGYCHNCQHAVNTESFIMEIECLHPKADSTFEKYLSAPMPEICPHWKEHVDTCPQCGKVARDIHPMDEPICSNCGYNPEPEED